MCLWVLRLFLSFYDVHPEVFFPSSSEEGTDSYLFTQTLTILVEGCSFELTYPLANSDIKQRSLNSSSVEVTETKAMR